MAGNNLLLERLFLAGVDSAGVVVQSVTGGWHEQVAVPGTGSWSPHSHLQTALLCLQKNSFAHFSFYTYMITFLQQSSQTLLILLFDEKHFSQLCLVIELEVSCSPIMHVVTGDLFHACCSPVSLSILDALQENSTLFPRWELEATLCCGTLYFNVLILYFEMTGTLAFPFLLSLSLFPLCLLPNN